MIPSIFISWHSTAEKEPLLSHVLFCFVFLLIYIVWTQGYLSYSMGDNPLVSLFIWTNCPRSGKREPLQAPISAMFP